MSMEHWWKDTDRGKLKHLEENPSQYQLFHHKFTWTGLGSNLVLCSEKLATNRLNLGTVRLVITIIIIIIIIL